MCDYDQFWSLAGRVAQSAEAMPNFSFCYVTSRKNQLLCTYIAVICVTKSRTGDYDFRACAHARGFRGSTFSVGRIRFAVCAERSRDKTFVF